MTHPTGNLPIVLRFVPMALAAFSIGLACLAGGPGAGTAAAATGPTTLTLYSVATAEQFVNNEDDRARGAGNNPFGSYSDITAATKEKGHGPFAGDLSLFTFTLYTNASLSHKAGSAAFTCQYNFNKNAFCDVSYELARGTLFAAGGFDFNATHFTLAITGGYGAYSRMTGNVATSPSRNNAQRLDFLIQPAGLWPFVLSICEKHAVRNVEGATVSKTIEDYRARSVVALLTACLACMALGVVAAGSRAAANGAAQFTIYSVATGEQYINNNDDEARGDVNNPFGVQTLGGQPLLKVENGQWTVLPVIKRWFTFKALHESRSPRPVRQRFSDLHLPIAISDKNAFCDATYQLGSGTLIGAGAFNFNATGFVLALTGGTEKYSRATGDVTAFSES